MSEQQTNINKRFNINENIKVIYIVSVITALLFIFGFCIFETFRTFTYLDAEETNPFGIILILIVFGVLTYCFYYEWLGQFILIIAFIFFILFIAFNFSEISLSQYKKIDRIE
jgi:glucose uptake protein GlcU